MIDRSQAASELKIVSAQVNNAISGVREGLWGAATRAAIEARDALDGIIEKLEENSSVESEFIDAVRPPMRSGGLGYSGSVRIKKDWTTREIHRPVSNAPPPPIAGRKPPVITPPPPKAEPPKPKEEPTPIPQEPVTFDLARITGMPEFLESFSKGTVIPLNDTEQKVSSLFNRLPAKTQLEVISRYRMSGKPVTMRIREVTIRVKES